MCRKLSILCLTLVVVALCVPASAAPPSIANPLKVDIDGASATPDDPNRTQPGWESWDFGFGPGPGPFAKNMQATHNTTLTLRGIRTDGADPGSRNRYQSTGVGDGRLGQDLFFVGQAGGTAMGLGKNYLKLDITISGLVPSSTNHFVVQLSDYDVAFGYNKDINFKGAGEPPLSKKAAWSKTNPSDWLTANGYANGYTVGDVNMPAGLAAQLLGTQDPGQLRRMLGIRADVRGSMTPFTTTFALDLVANGAGIAMTSLYGWNHMTTWSGSQHMPINSIKIIPEPATVALLGLGGLALLRRRK